jgi:beta-xylosidase
MDQGKSSTNGPHQGAWVNTATGEDWFLHFQDKGVYGRVLHLQPMTWKDNWPVIGIDKDGNGKGEPVLTYKKPNVGKTYPVTTPQESDEFNSRVPGLQWQWMANAKPVWMFMNTAKGAIRLYSYQLPNNAVNLWFAPNVLLQKFPADEFTATTKITFTPNLKLEDEKTGLTIMGFSYANIAMKSKKDGIYLVFTTCINADKGKQEQEEIITKLSSATVYLRVKVEKNTVCSFGYSTDGIDFKNIGRPFTAEPGRWIGAKVGLFCTRTNQINDSGYADVDWFRITANN